MSNSTKLAVVTGATGGIGTATCLKLSNLGYSIVAQYRNGHERARHLAEKVESRGVSCILVSTDLSSIDGIEKVIMTVDETLDAASDNKLSALVNNAAKLLGPSFFEATASSFDEYFAINTRAPFFLSQMLSRRMHTGGSIVNVSSANAHFSSPGDTVYAMSKAAIESLTFNMAEAVAARGIRVNSVVPGFTDNGHEGFRIPEVRAYMSSFAVLGGVTEAATVADAIEFLVSDRSSRTTGALLDVSGGSLLGARGSRAQSVRDLFQSHTDETGSTSEAE